MKRILVASAVIVALTGLTFTSCKKETPDTETQSAVDNNICETEFGKSMTTINGFAIKENGIKTMMTAAEALAGSPTIIVDPADTLDGFPVTMTIDYGSAPGIQDAVDGKYRSGKVICVFSDNWTNVGSYVRVTLVNYISGGASYSCDSMRITHTATSTFSHQIFKGRCSSTAWSGILQWEGIRTFNSTQTGGTATPTDFTDDVHKYTITGNASGVNRDGKAYTVNVSVPIVKRTSCSWIESGRVDITPEGLATRTVDYGSGVCDAQATLTINGNTFTFNMN
jgi:translation initiation factor 1 (eIF-1/SUI1)